MTSNEDRLRPVTREQSNLLCYLLVKLRNKEELRKRNMKKQLPAVVAKNRGQAENLIIPKGGQAAARENRYWSDEETLCLVRIRASFPRHYRGPVWKRVSSTLSDLNFPRSPESCRNRWCTLLKWLKRRIQNACVRPQPIYHSLLVDFFSQ